MRSIIDEIAAAEAQAEELKNKAAASARERLALAKADAEQQLVQLENDERESTKQALLRAEAEGEEKARETLDGILLSADKQCVLAEERLDAAVEHLVKKVQELQ